MTSIDRRHFKIAIPFELKRWLAIEAAKNDRSQSAEILAAIEEYRVRQNEKSGTTA